MRLPRIIALCLLLLLPCAARADDVGPQQAQALRQQLQNWLAGLLGPSVKLPDLPWQVTGEGDHYVIAWPIHGLDKPTGDVTVAATVRPLDANRWSIDAVNVPPTAALTLDLPQAGDAAGGPITFAYTVGKQETKGVIDVSLQSASKLHSEVADLAVTTENAAQHQEQHFEHYLVDTSLTPAQDGRLNLSLEGTVNEWRSAAQVTGSAPVAIGIHTMRAVGRIDGINRDRVGALLTAIGGLIGTLPADAMTKPNPGDLPAATRAQARLMIASLTDMLTAVSVEETLDRVQVEMAGLGGLTLQHLQLGFGGEAPKGRLHTWLDIGLDGLASPSLPPKIAAYLPHHVEIKPSLSGILTADLKQLALDATEENGDNKRFAPDVAAIFAHGGMDLGVETLAFDLGPAQVEGVGHIALLAPDRWRGEAHLSATGFDELVAQARGNPDLQQAIPVLIMLRGLAKADGKRLVWDIVSDGPTIKVNGVDLSKLGGNDKPKGKPGQPPSR